MGSELSQRLKQNINFHLELDLARYQTVGFHSSKALKHLLKFKHMLSHWVNKLIHLTLNKKIMFPTEEAFIQLLLIKVAFV